jgi:hypothetical protein
VPAVTSLTGQIEGRLYLLFSIFELTLRVRTSEEIIRYNSGRSVESAEEN